MRKALNRAYKEARRSEAYQNNVGGAVDEPDTGESRQYELSPTCPQCAQAIEEVDLGTRTLYRCTSCKYRTSKLKD